MKRVYKRVSREKFCYCIGKKATYEDDTTILSNEYCSLDGGHTAFFAFCGGVSEKIAYKVVRRRLLEYYVLKDLL